MALRPSNPDPKSKAAEREAAQQDVFLREVDDALREDQLSGFFKRYGVPLIAAIVIGLAAFGGYLWWHHEQTTAANERGEQMIVALDDLDAGNLKAADDKLAQLASEGDDASGAAARLLRAGIALDQDRKADALKLYGEVAADGSVPQPYRDLATVRQVAANFDAMKPDDVIARLKPLAVPESAWFGVAGELVGMAYLKQGKNDLAGPLFAKIARDEDTPDSLRSRSRQLAGLLGADAVDDVIVEKGEGNGSATPQPAT